MRNIFAFLCLLLVTVSYGQSTTFDTSGTWTCPTGVTSVTVECWGGGGGGGYAAANNNGNNSIGTGGGGGCYSQKVVSVIPGNIYTVTVGGGGVGGNNVSINGQAGGDSWFINSTLINAKGGIGGTGNNADTTGNVGLGNPPGSIGDVIYVGGNGGVGRLYSRFGAPRIAGGGGGGSAGSMGNGNGPSPLQSSVGAPGSGTGGYGGAGSGGFSQGGNGTAPGGGGGGGVVINTNTPPYEVNGGDGGTGRVVITETSPLPVDLIYFTASFTGEGAVLFKWKVAAKDTKRMAYSIEASTDGERFTEVYSKEHTGTIPAGYSYVYNRAGKEELYYRLKYAGEDGFAKYSKVVQVGNRSPANNTTPDIYPNPAGDVSFISYNAPVESSLVVYVYDMEGRKVLSRKYSVEQGANRLNLEIAWLHPGTYSVQMFDTNSRLLFTAGLIKQ